MELNDELDNMIHRWNWNPLHLRLVSSLYKSWEVSKPQLDHRHRTTLSLPLLTTQPSNPGTTQPSSHSATGPVSHCTIHYLANIARGPLGHSTTQLILRWNIYTITNPLKWCDMYTNFTKNIYRLVWHFSPTNRIVEHMIFLPSITNPFSVTNEDVKWISMLKGACLPQVMWPKSPKFSFKKIKYLFKLSQSCSINHVLF